MTRADVIVVGGGVNGASTAFHLGSQELETSSCSSAGTSAPEPGQESGSLVRMHYTNEPESGWPSRPQDLQRFPEPRGRRLRLRGDRLPQIVPRGYEAALARNVARQQGLGIKTEAIAPSRLTDLLPGMPHHDDVGAAAWGPIQASRIRTRRRSPSQRPRGGWARPSRRVAR